jgi:hypothetical protein
MDKRDGQFGSHGNKTHSYARPPIDVRKVPADSVPYGDSISLNGRTVWAAYDADGCLVAVGASVPEVRRKYRAHKIAESAERVRKGEGI